MRNQLADLSTQGPLALCRTRKTFLKRVQIALGGTGNTGHMLGAPPECRPAWPHAQIQGSDEAWQKPNQEDPEK